MKICSEVSYGENEFPVEMCISQLITEILSFFCFTRPKLFLALLTIAVQCKTRWSCGQNSWLSTRSQPSQAKPKHFYFSIVFPGLSQNLTKNQSCNARCSDFFKLNIEVLTIRVLKKQSEIKNSAHILIQPQTVFCSVRPISHLHSFRQKLTVNLWQIVLRCHSLNFKAL